MRFAVLQSTRMHAHCGFETRSAHADSRRGVTFVELVAVLLVMGIFAAAAVPTFVDSLIFHRVESAARRFKADLQLVRHTARLTSSTQTLTLIGLTYSTTGIANFDRPSQIYAVDLSQRPYSLDALAANFGGLTSISYDGYGKPSSGGTVVLQAGGHSCTLTIDAVTGEITIGPIVQ